MDSKRSKTRTAHTVRREKINPTREGERPFSSNVEERERERGEREFWSERRDRVLRFIM